MKHYVRAISYGATFLAVLALLACGGRQTTASKSAAAYDEAMKKGVPIAGGEHGGHTNDTADGATATATTADQNKGTSQMPGMDHSSAGMDHSTMPGMPHAAAAAGSEMAGMDHASMSGASHSTMPGMQHTDPAAGTHGMAAMDHSKMPGMNHGGSVPGAHDMAGMDHSTTAGMDHSTMAGMDHSRMSATTQAGSPSHDMAGMNGDSMAGMTGMHHGTSVTPPAIAPPTTNTAIAGAQPAVTLHADGFDAPAASAIQESAKASSGMDHSMKEEAPAVRNPGQTAPHQHPVPPKPPDGHPDHGIGEAS